VQAVIRRKPTVRPQPGSRGNYLTPKRGRPTTEGTTISPSTPEQTEDEEAVSAEQVQSQRGRLRASPSTPRPEEEEKASTRPAYAFKRVFPTTTTRTEVPPTTSPPRIYRPFQDDTIRTHHPPFNRQFITTTTTSTEPPSSPTSAQENEDDLVEEGEEEETEDDQPYTTDEEENYETHTAVNGHVGGGFMHMALENNTFEEQTDRIDTGHYEQETTPSRLEIIKHPRNKTTFDVLTMNPEHALVQDDNFKGFIDSASIDSADQVDKKGEKVISVVTTKSVSKIDEPVTLPPDLANKNQMAPPPNMDMHLGMMNNSTESWLVVASVQTSRSVSGARFLPHSAVTQEEHPLQSLQSLQSNPKQNPTSQKQETTKPPPTTLLPQESSSAQTSSSPPPPKISTESITDKLDRVQSELSSGILTGGFQPGSNKLQLEVVPDVMAVKPSTETTSSSSTPSTTSTTTTEGTTKGPAKPPAVPVVIRKFNPSNRKTTTVAPHPYHKQTSTSPSPKKSSLLDSIRFDELPPDLLPSGFKPRIPSRPRTTTAAPKELMQGDDASKFTNDTRITTSTVVTTTTSTTTERTAAPKGIEALLKNVKFEDVGSFLPPGYKLSSTTTTTTEKPKNLFETLGIKFEVPKALLPPGYQPPSSTTTTSTTTKKPTGVEALAGKIKFEDVSSFLPKDYKPPPSSEAPALPAGAKPVDISAFLPPGYNLSNSTTKSPLDSILSKVQFQEPAGLLPPGYKATPEESASSASPSTASAAPGVKVVFPSRPGGGGGIGGRKPLPKPTTGRPVAFTPPTPTIRKGPPTR